MRWLGLLLMVTAVSVAALAPVRTTRRHLRAKEEIADTVRHAVGDTIVNPPVTRVAVSGYDKALRSRKESFFVTNRLPASETIVKVELTIGYYDMKGRELNSRRAAVDCDIPPGATRNLTIPAWDTQQSFYYHRSQRPRRAVATPYNVKFTIDRVIVKQ